MPLFYLSICIILKKIFFTLIKLKFKTFQIYRKFIHFYFFILLLWILIIINDNFLLIIIFKALIQMHLYMLYHYLILKYIYNTNTLIEYDIFY